MQHSHDAACSLHALCLYSQGVCFSSAHICAPCSADSTSVALKLGMLRALVGVYLKVARLHFWIVRCVCRRFGVTTDLGRYVAAHDILLDMDWDILVAGHLDGPGTRLDVEISAEYAADVILAASTAISAAQAGELPLPAIPEKYQNNAWLFVWQFQGTQIQACYDVIVERWAHRLAGVDVYGYSHCEVAYTYVALDTGVAA